MNDGLKNKITLDPIINATPELQGVTIDPHPEITFHWWELGEFLADEGDHHDQAQLIAALSGALEPVSPDGIARIQRLAEYLLKGSAQGSYRYDDIVTFLRELLTRLVNQGPAGGCA